MADDETPGTKPDETKPKVIDLAEERDRRKKKPVEKERVPKNETYLAVARAINRDPLIRLPEFPVRYYTVGRSGGIRGVLEELKDGVVQFTGLQAVSNTIIRYVVDELRGRPGYGYDMGHAKKAADFWLGITEPITYPKAVKWANDPELAFSRLPWTYEPDFEGDKMPLFSEIMGRISNSEALCHWIASLFFDDSNIQQYVWCHGFGQNGKGALSRFLEKVFGIGYRSMQPPGLNDKHWTAGLLGARLCVFPDCNAQGFPASGLFKSLTGGDSIMVDQKFEPAFNVKLNCKFMFQSNERPSLSSEKADMRRAIYCEFKPLPDEVTDDSGYEARLWEEGGYFLSTCIHNYLKAYPNHGAIRTNHADLEDWISVLEEPFEVLLERCFVLGPTEQCKPSDMQDVLAQTFKDRKNQLAFISLLERKHGVKKKNVRIDGLATPRKTYVGIRLKYPLNMERGVNVF